MVEVIRKQWVSDVMNVEMFQQYCSKDHGGNDIPVSLPARMSCRAWWNCTYGLSCHFRGKTAGCWCPSAGCPRQSRVLVALSAGNLDKSRLPRQCGILHVLLHRIWDWQGRRNLGGIHTNGWSCLINYSVCQTMYKTQGNRHRGLCPLPSMFESQ